MTEKNVAVILTAAIVAVGGLVLVALARVVKGKHH